MPVYIAKVKYSHNGRPNTEAEVFQSDNITEALILLKSCVRGGTILLLADKKYYDHERRLLTCAKVAQ